MEITNHILIAAVLLALVVGVLSVLAKLLDHPSKFPTSIPIVGLRKQSLSIARASLRQLTGGIATMLEGYGQFGKVGRPFVVLDPSGQQEMLLPVKYLKWFSEQSDNKLSSHGVRQERHAVRYLDIGIEIDTTMYFIKLISRDRLARNLQMAQRSMYEETRRTVDAVFGASDDWTEINVYESLQDIVLPILHRIFLGKPLCHNRQLVASLDRYVLVMGLGTIFVGELPRVLKTAVAPLVNLPLMYYRRKVLKVLTPIVEYEMSQLDDQSSNREHDESSFIRQCALLSSKSAVDSRGDASRVSEMIMAMVFAGSTSTVSQGTNLLLDIVNSPKDMYLVENLRNEALSTLPTESAWHSAESFARQELIDSTIRETLRFHPILVKGLTKEVVPSGGVVLPDGTILPQGGWVGVPVLAIHRDEQYYSNAEAFDPFRSVKARAARETKRSGTMEDDLEAVKPSTTYLGFGYGRHACPGRWLAVLMLKMLISYVTLNYDLQSTGPTPSLKVIGDASLPPISATVRVRRRKGVKS